MGALFNHAICWEFGNPITGLVRGSGVRQSSKRSRVPVVLTIELVTRGVGMRERTLVQELLHHASLKITPTFIRRR